MARHCRKCGKRISGHALGKAIAGGLVLGPVGAIAGAAHGISKELDGENLCDICRLNELTHQANMARLRVARGREGLYDK